MKCEIKSSCEDGKLTIFLSGEINSANAAEVKKEVDRQLAEHPSGSVVLDVGQLRAISSAGLRIILRLKQDVDDTKIVNAHSDLYGIFDMTGFTDMMEIEKAYRVISVEGCEVIGQGANGKVYRINGDTIVKVYVNPDSLADIHRERELARTAFVAGIPTAIPYDVVRIEGGGYGSVFEMLNATSFARLLINRERPMDEVVGMSVDLLKLIHSKTAEKGAVPDMKQVALDWAAFMKDHLPAELYEKLHVLIDVLPEDPHLLHGDYHIKNIELQDNEVLLIDMDTLSHGHPVFELAGMFNSYVGYGAADPGRVEQFLGLSYEDTCIFWKKSLSRYLGTEDPERLKEVEDKAKILGYTRILHREICRRMQGKEASEALIGICRKELGELLPKVDTLLF